MDSGLTLHELRGAALESWLDALGALRIRVFHEYPYLYEGTLAYEWDYLRTYVNSPNSLVVLVTDGMNKVVGATTCLPLSDEGSEFQQPFIEHGYAVEEVCYFGESILLPEYRGQGLGKEFFARREAQVERLGLRWAAFCAVDRPVHHPRRPAGYRPLDEFWRAQGYEKHPNMKASFSWKEIGADAESPQSLTFWMKSWKL